MDPVTAFGLAAGVLQVVDLSFTALSKCREIYTDGSLAENRSTEEITRYLGETTDRLKTALRNAPSARSQDSTDVIDISTKCSKTAEELLTELAKMCIASGGGRRQAIAKGIRAIRRKKFIADSQQKLETYQRLLDTRILARLNSHSVQQAEDFQSLDHGVKDLAAALDQGRNTVAQLLAVQSSEIRQHLDCRLNEHAQADQESKAQAQFKDSLFYPEIYSRQDDIPVAHEGTCRWIFVDRDCDGKLESHPWPSLVDWFKHGMSGFLNLNHPLKENFVVQYNHIRVPYSSIIDSSTSKKCFTALFSCRKSDSNAGKGDEPYWLSGKPGSGKSTLMKYITNEFRTHIKKEDTSSSEMVVASFFFWNSGSTLQKSLVGFLRSLLYQIADQQPDLVPVMDNPQANPTTTPNTSFRRTELFAWTEQRLSIVLRRILDHMPPSIDLYIFIDGLDEFVGDEDDLIALVRLMHQTPRVKVCVSSRPEQVFRLGFAQSPQIRLQDLNYLDMKKTVEDRLHPILNRHFPEDETDIESLIDDTVHKAQGVFLWLELMTKSLRNGAYNADTMRELYEKLDRTPDTLEGLYQHMLDSLDKSYLSEAFRYFGLLIASEEMRKPPKLLDLVFTESELWDYALRNDREYFASPDFMHHCLRVETRILTRCAGLVEIEDRPIPFLEGTYGYVHNPGDSSLGDPDYHEQEDRTLIRANVNATSDGQNPSRHLRSVQLIHRTVKEFLQFHHKGFFQRPDERSAAALALVRGKLGVMNLIPILISRVKVGQMILTFFSVVEDIMDDLITLENSASISNIDQAFEDAIIRIVNQIYKDIEPIDVALNGPSVPWFERYRRKQIGSGPTHAYPVWCDIGTLPFNDVHGFAAFFGCQSHILHSATLHDSSQKLIDYLLACSLTGSRLLYWGFRLESNQIFRPHRAMALFVIIRELLRRGASSTPYIEPDCWADNMAPLSAWGAFLNSAVPPMRLNHDERADFMKGINIQPLANLSRLNDVLKEIVTHFLSHGADVNFSVFSTYTLHIMESDLMRVEIALEETPLSLVESSVTSSGLHPLDVLSDMLRSSGGLTRRRCHLVRFWETKPQAEKYSHILEGRWYCLSKGLSDCLCEILHWHQRCSDFVGNLVEIDRELQGRIDDLVLHVTESDLVETPSARPAPTNDEAKRTETDENIPKQEAREDNLARNDDKNLEKADKEG